MSKKSIFNEYAKQFTEKSMNTTFNPKEITHVAFSGNGKFKVPENKYDEFYKKYYECMIKGEKLFIIEKMNENVPIGFFIDIEIPKGDENEYKDIKISEIKEIIKVSESIFKTYLVNYSSIFVLSKRNNRYHINFPEIILTNIIAQKLIKQIILSLPDTLKKLIDTSVYRTGLRLFGSQKKEIEIEKEKEKWNEFNNEPYKSVYELIEIVDNKINFISKISYTKFQNLIVRKKLNTKLTEVNKEILSKTQEKIQGKEIKTKGVENPKIILEITSLIKDLKENYESLNNYQFEDNFINRIVTTQNKTGVLCFYVNINEKHCPFKCREHQRANSPIYFEISINGIYIKCYDEDCVGYKFPDESFALPENMESLYPELYLAISSKYWKTNIELTPKIRKLLEESLNASHFRVAKVAFNIYKERFRIDEIKNPDWYEFVDHCWKKSHIMNILISEELPKYYKAIKISNEGIQSDNLQEFIKSGAQEKLEENMRNTMVDSLINKLENVTFKKAILNEMYFLFKNLEPNFVNKLDANPYLIGFKNGVYDLSTKTFRDGLQSDYITFTTGYDYIEYDETLEEIQEIYSFLEKIVPNKKVKEYLLKIIGRSLSGVNDEKFYIFTGLSGANGKSTLINFLEYTLGDYTTASDTSLLTNKKAISSSASPDIFRLKGRRLIAFQEPEADDKLNTSIIKSFSGGDSIISRELYKAPISFKLQGSLFLCCNKIPSINSTGDGGIQRRLRVVEFISRFCDNPKKEHEFKIDPTIKTKIKQWKPYFMSILLHYYHVHEQEEIKNGKIEEPEEVMIATNNYQQENDIFNDFIEDYLEESEDDFSSLKDIYVSFTGWWTENNSSISKMPSMKDLRNNLIIKFKEIKVKSVKGFSIKIKSNEEIFIDDADY
jgi:P4 family phage/plasmid primase-like protien